MRETYEFRVVEEVASKLFAPTEGKRLGDSVRQVEIDTDDPRFQTIGKLQAKTRAKMGRSFFYGWILRHRYSEKELEQAAFFRLELTSTFEPTGEECGTKYDEATGCPHCGAGARQITPLFLDPKRIPKGKDISRTIAGEIVVSRRMAELFSRHNITGAEVRPIRSNRSSSAESQDWFQLMVSGTKAKICAPTRLGINPFDDDEKSEYRCPLGDLIGLNVLSEVSIESISLGTDDIVCSQQFIGVRRGLLRPERIILISPKVRRLIESEKLKRVDIEIAHLAGTA